jgi:hypothetical protein
VYSATGRFASTAAQIAAPRACLSSRVDGIDVDEYLFHRHLIRFVPRDYLAQWNSGYLRARQLAVRRLDHRWRRSELALLIQNKAGDAQAGSMPNSC